MNAIAEFKKKHEQGAFNYDKYNENDDFVEETDNERKIRFTKFINMLRKVLPEWMEQL